jgi:hypothetical protein
MHEYVDVIYLNHKKRQYMSIKISKEILMSLPQKPCPEGLSWYDEHGSEDLLKTLIDLNEYYPTWARWLFTRMMNKKQCVEIAVFAAELVLPIYEKKHPNDKRSRDSIKPAKRYLKNGNTATAAAYDADAADTAAAFAAYAAADAADAAAADAYASYSAAAAYAAAAADAVAAADASENKKQTELKIIKEAVRILERDNA